MDTFSEYAKIGQDPIRFEFRTGMAVYGNILKDGMLRSLGINGAGYLVGEGMMVSNNLHDITELCAFIVEIDGQTLVSGWKFVSDEKTEKDGVTTVKITLENDVFPVSVDVITVYSGTGAFSRSLEITNKSDKPAPITRLSPFCGMLETTPEWRKRLQNKEESPYRLGYFDNTYHMNEGQFKWHELHNDCYSFGGRFTRCRHRHPFFVLENKARGTTYACQLAYSGGYKFSFDFNAHQNDGNLAVVCELDGLKPLRVMAPGEKITVPEMIISAVNGDLDDAVNNMHAFIRKAVMKKPHGEGCYLETAGGGRVNDAKAGALRAKNNGFDIFYIDAGWYFPEGQECLSWTGTWEPDPVRFPNGMRELTDYCHEIGIKLGLWMEPERVGSNSPIAEKDVDKYLVEVDGKSHGGHPKWDKGGLYDLSRKDVCDYIEKQICNMIEKTGLDMFRLDFNLDYKAPWCVNDVMGYRESCDFRYCENLYAMYDRIRSKYPNVIFENCASGGGRTDLGLVKYFDHTWVTDNPVAPRCFAITNGMTMALPPELVDRLVTTMDAPKFGNLTFDLYQLLFVRPTSHFPGTNPENPLQIKKFREFMDVYTNFVKPFQKDCLIYHHTPSFDDNEPKGVGVLEESSSDKTRDMLGVFALSDPETDGITVRLKGVDAGLNYVVRALESGETFRASGYDLKYKGLTVKIKAALTAEAFILESEK